MAVDVALVGVAASAAAGQTQYDLVPLAVSPGGGGEAYAIYRGVAAGGVDTAVYWPTPDQSVSLGPVNGYPLGTLAYGIYGNQEVGIAIRAGSFTGLSSATNQFTISVPGPPDPMKGNTTYGFNYAVIG